jgi:uncharacterized protein YcnI
VSRSVLTFGSGDKTSKLEVKLPTDTPFTSVSVKPVESWSAQVITSDLPKPVTVSGTTVTKVPSSVVWTADATHQIGQNQYQAFPLSVGKLSAAGTTVTLKAAQTYTDGTVVNWDEQSAEGQPKPKHRRRVAPQSPGLWRDLRPATAPGLLPSERIRPSREHTVTVRLALSPEAC